MQGFGGVGDAMSDVTHFDVGQGGAHNKTVAFAVFSHSRPS
jgi:hypothetical protein